MKPASKRQHWERHHDDGGQEGHVQGAGEVQVRGGHVGQARAAALQRAGARGGRLPRGRQVALQRVDDGQHVRHLPGRHPRLRAQDAS